MGVSTGTPPYTQTQTRTGRRPGALIRAVRPPPARPGSPDRPLPTPCLLVGDFNTFQGLGGVPPRILELVTAPAATTRPPTAGSRQAGVREEGAEPLGYKLGFFYNF